MTFLLFVLPPWPGPVGNDNGVRLLVVDGMKARATPKRGRAHETDRGRAG